MNHTTSNSMVQFQKLLNEGWKDRSLYERRSDLDNRINGDPQYFKKGGKERRKIEERRGVEERRDGWIRVGTWCSECVFDK